MHEDLASEVDGRRRYIPWNVILPIIGIIVAIIVVRSLTRSWAEKHEQKQVAVETKTTYQVTTRCYNCFEILHLEIPFGLTYKQWLDKKGKCPHCRHILDKDTPLCQKQYGLFENYRCGQNNE